MLALDVLGKAKGRSGNRSIEIESLQNALLRSKRAYHHLLSLSGRIDSRGDFMAKQAKSGKSSQKLMRKRLENSLPWSLSRWFSSLWRQKK
jgi:hypothetical protein